jgi:superfamily I DNA and/or RNA helicase
MKAAKDPVFAEKYSLLNANGLFVKNLENIQGDERDIIIMTTTFGKDEEGRFRKRFGPPGNNNGYRLLNVIVTRAKDKFYICTSIPENEILNYERMLEINQ